jgi:coniferyl-aldehyde dehydrogenase
MRPEKRSLAYYLQPGRVEVRYEPLGCVGIIAPWNYPINLTLIPLIDALAAGNRIMIKLSEYAPATAKAIQVLIAEIFSEDEVCVVTGDAQLAQAFAQLPFDHLFYTGSTGIGKRVMAAAAENLTPVTLELGGKSPCFLSRSADCKTSAEKLAFGKCINGGQTCVAPDVLFCPEEKLELFCTAFFDAIEKMYPNLPENNDYTHIINDNHAQRLRSLISDARDKQARILTFREESQHTVTHRGMFPTLILDVSEEMQVWQEEIFGPILVVKTYQKNEEVLKQLRHWPSPLAFYIFSNAREEIEQLIEQTRSGGVCINDTLIQVAVDDAPFGGVGPSGFGRYHGPEGFKTFSNARTVLMRPSMNLAKVLYPPYGTTLQKLFFKALQRKR